MSNHGAARPFPVLGREGDYPDAGFEKTMSLSPDGLRLSISNKLNSVNKLCGSSVGDFLLIENRGTATKIFIPLEAEELEVSIPVDRLWGITSLVLMQISTESVELVDADNKLFDSFFSSPGGTKFEIRPGEVLGVGEPQFVNVGGSSGTSWIQFDLNEGSSLDYRVSTGATGNVVIHLGRDLYKAAMVAMTSPEVRHWATLSLAKPGLEYAIQSVLGDSTEELDEKPAWFEGLFIRLTAMGIEKEEDIQELSDLQYITMKMLEAEVLEPLIKAISEAQLEDR